MSSSVVAHSTDEVAERRDLQGVIAARAARQRRSKRRRRALVWGARTGIVTLLLVSWNYAGTRSKYWSFVIGTPARAWAIMRSWLAEKDFWTRDVWITLQEAGIGYLIGVTVALLLVGIVTPFPGLFRFLRPFLSALNSLPKIILAPLFILWFGFAMSGKIAFVTAAIFFVVFYGVHSGVTSIDRDLIDHARMLGGSRFQLIPTLYLPAIATWVVVSLRISATISLLAAVVSEYLGSQVGLGHRIATGRSALRVDMVLAGIFFVGFIALLIDRLLLRLQRKFEKWSVF
jgi:NitT/TauT family transport system permease protein